MKCVTKLSHRSNSNKGDGEGEGEEWEDEGHGSGQQGNGGSSGNSGGNKRKRDDIETVLESHGQQTHEVDPQDRLARGGPRRNTYSDLWKALGAVGALDEQLSCTPVKALARKEKVSNYIPICG
ncbi:hypothetical protein AB1Y20_017245 [Prymnesium parvum]|uniref:Ribosome biogenesis protein NOP53 n=1 Tax=Prymnesium parvum TaxID=97485 RepID=A0AB34JMR8_PRYPA